MRSWRIDAAVEKPTNAAGSPYSLEAEQRNILQALDIDYPSEEPLEVPVLRLGALETRPEWGTPGQEVILTVLGGIGIGLKPPHLQFS